METAQLKRHSRAKVKERLAQMSAEEKRKKSYEACMNVIKSSEFASAHTIMVYKAMKNECDPALIAEAAVKMGKTVAYPLCCENNTLKVLTPKTENAFTMGAYGISEPIESECDELDIKKLELIIVPGLAFDKNNVRLGRGAGYYDRLLTKCENAIKIGFAFDVQMADSLPEDGNDIRMDKIVTNI
ncbi:MAG: 5-formyltetrahydrofolate cyclo-ligase [Clostridia bacterium]|nr:5-formyltetrahydrofolate cyclo-ligase [Clostridia bacterium]